MKLLGVEIGDYDPFGCLWTSRLRDWLIDQSYDLSGLYEDLDINISQELIQTLDKFQDIAYRAGCTNIAQVEYIYQLEQHLEEIEAHLKKLASKIKDD